MTTTTAPTLTAGETDAAARIRHAARCPGADYRATTGRRGDRLVRCLGCLRFALDIAAARHMPRTATTTPNPTPKVTPAPVVAPAATQPRARWFCPAHLRPVTWRGRGCVKCVAELAESRERRAARRRVVQS